MKYFILVLITILVTGCNIDGIETNPILSKKVFLTNGQYSAIDIGGSANVDDICQYEADLSEDTAGITFLAFNKSNGVSFYDRVDDPELSSHWYNAGNHVAWGRRFFLDKDDPLEFDQFGNKIEIVKAWSNLTTGGHNVNANDCGEMTSATGSARYYSNGNINAGHEICETAFMRLICVEI